MLYSRPRYRTLIKFEMVYYGILSYTTYIQQESYYVSKHTGSRVF